MKRKQIAKALDALPDFAIYILRISMIICCVTLLIALVLFAMLFSKSVFDNGLYMTACTFLEGPPMLLLIAHLVIVAIIDFGGK